VEASSQLELMSPIAVPAKSRRVLAAEDNPVIQTMLRNMLKHWGYEAVMARDGLEAWKILRSENAPRLAILDWMMPGMDGVEVCRHIRAAARELYIYVVLLTARTQSGDIIQGMDAGADDYLTKPFAAAELRVRLRAGTRILDLQEELLATREALRVQATHDGLTGLLNRTAVMEALRAELGRASRAHQPISVVLTDLDYFKKVNDTYGHLVGDSVLAESAARMKATLRCYDSLGRYGGEEFLFVLPGCAAEGAAQQAERIREAFAAQPFSNATAPLPLTCSIGVASRDLPELEHADQLVREADLALYRAKRRGRNRVELWEAWAPEVIEAELLPAGAESCVLQR
jgi:two-component system, cell cycle response regulator